MIEKLIQEINSNQITLSFVEIGAGVPVASLFFNNPNASKTVIESSSPYNNSREVYKIPSDVRLVSKDAVNIISSSFQSVFVSSFQIPSNNQIIPHGWICVDLKTFETYFFHITLPTNFTRQECIKTIGELGIKILHYCIFHDYKVLENTYIDICSTREPPYVQKCEDVLVVIKDGKEIRFEDEYRDVENILIYKGSFNPLHEGHVKLIEKAKEIYSGNPLFIISTNTFEKGLVDYNDLFERIKTINEAGYVVGIFQNGFFFDNLDFLRRRTFGKSKLICCCGLDTLDRLVTCFKKWNFSKKEHEQANNFLFKLPRNNSEQIESANKKFMEMLFEDFTFSVFDRTQGDKSCLSWANLNIDFHEFNVDISSSQIRNSNKGT